MIFFLRAKYLRNISGVGGSPGYTRVAAQAHCRARHYTPPGLWMAWKASRAGARAATPSGEAWGCHCAHARGHCPTVSGGGGRERERGAGKKEAGAIFSPLSGRDNRKKLLSSAEPGHGPLLGASQGVAREANQRQPRPTASLPTSLPSAGASASGCEALTRLPERGGAAFLLFPFFLGTGPSPLPCRLWPRPAPRTPRHGESRLLSLPRLSSRASGGRGLSSRRGPSPFPPSRCPPPSPVIPAVVGGGALLMTRQNAPLPPHRPCGRLLALMAGVEWTDAVASKNGG